MKELLSAFAAGVIFAVGLVVGGMTAPANVIAFLDVTGRWDPALAFVMVGGIAVYSLAYWGVARRRQMRTEAEVAAPTRVDLRLVLGSVIFGVGWGIAGFCPGPALVAAATGSLHAVVFGLSMVATFAVRRAIP